MNVTISPATRCSLENLMHLVYLCDQYAGDPVRVRAYMADAQFHLDCILEAEGLRPAREQKIA